MMWLRECEPSKKVQLFGTLFRFDGDLLKDLCRLAHECLLE